MIGKLDEYLRFQETALSLRAQRQQLLASNIANADTPNYKARDIDFSSALQNALTPAGQASSEMTKTSAAHLSAPGTTSSGGAPSALSQRPAGKRGWQHRGYGYRTQSVRRQCNSL